MLVLPNLCQDCFINVNAFDSVYVSVSFECCIIWSKQNHKDTIPSLRWYSSTSIWKVIKREFSLSRHMKI
jgi:hypothetical protein